MCETTIYVVLYYRDFFYSIVSYHTKEYSEVFENPITLI